MTSLLKKDWSDTEGKMGRVHLSKFNIVNKGDISATYLTHSRWPLILYVCEFLKNLYQNLSRNKFFIKGNLEGLLRS